MGVEEPVVFYSWQSDLPNSTNRGLIEAALAKACKELSAQLDQPIRVDADTQGASGAPDIAATILDKIARASVVVADVSIIGQTSVADSDPAKVRPSPNANVMFELGYAKHALGPERVIMVCNTAYGRIEELPFDIRGRSVLGYEFKHGTGERPAGPRNDIAGKLKVALAAALETARHARTSHEDGERARRAEERARFDALRARLVASSLSEGPIKVALDRPVVVLHLVPAIALDGTSRIDLQRDSETVVAELSPKGARSWSWFHDAESIAAASAGSADQRVRSVSRLFETGALQVCVAVAALEDSRDANGVAFAALRSLTRVLPALAKLQLGGRCYVSLDVLGTKGVIITPDSSSVDFDQKGRQVPDDSFAAPAAVAEKLEVDDVGRILKPMLDRFWRTAGFRECWYLNEEGALRPRWR